MIHLVGEPDNQAHSASNNSQPVVQSSVESIGSHRVGIIAADKIKNECANCHRLQRDLNLSQNASSMRKPSIRNQQTDPSIVELIKVILVERRVLIRLAELGFKKLTKYRDTVKDL